MSFINQLLSLGDSMGEGGSVVIVVAPPVVPSDATTNAPAVNSSMIADATPTVINVAFDKNSDITGDITSQLTVLIDGTPDTVVSAAFISGHQMNITITSSVTNGETVTWAYATGAGSINAVADPMTEFAAGTFGATNNVLIPPTISSLIVDDVDDTLDATISTLTVSASVTDWIVSSDSTTPDEDDLRWVQSSPPTVNLGSWETPVTVYAWVMDAVKTISGATTDTATASDTTAPSITEFVVANSTNTLTANITTLTESEAVTDWIVSLDSTTPDSVDGRWVQVEPATVGLGAWEASVTVYAWIMDAAENISNVMQAAATASDTTAPTSPGTLTVAASGSTVINITVNAAGADAHSGIDHYTLDWSPNGSDTWLPLETDWDGTQRAHTGRTAETAYYYRTKAVDLGGNSSAAYSTGNDTTGVASGVDATVGTTGPPTYDYADLWDASDTEVTDALIEVYAGAYQSPGGTTSAAILKAQTIRSAAGEAVTLNADGGTIKGIVNLGNEGATIAGQILLQGESAANRMLFRGNYDTPITDQNTDEQGVRIHWECADVYLKWLDLDEIEMGIEGVGTVGGTITIDGCKIRNAGSESGPSHPIYIDQAQVGTFNCIDPDIALIYVGFGVKTRYSVANFTNGTITDNAAGDGASACIGASNAGELNITGTTLNVGPDGNKEAIRYADNLGGGTEHTGDITVTNASIDGGDHANAVALHVSVDNTQDRNVTFNGVAFTNFANFNSGSPPYYGLMKHTGLGALTVAFNGCTHDAVAFGNTANAFFSSLGTSDYIVMTDTSSGTGPALHEHAELAFSGTSYNPFTKLIVVPGGGGHSDSNWRGVYALDTGVNPPAWGDAKIDSSTCLGGSFDDDFPGAVNEGVGTQHAWKPSARHLSASPCYIPTKNWHYFHGYAIYHIDAGTTCGHAIGNGDHAWRETTNDWAHLQLSGGIELGGAHQMQADLDDGDGKACCWDPVHEVMWIIASVNGYNTGYYDPVTDSTSVVSTTGVPTDSPTEASLCYVDDGVNRRLYSFGGELGGDPTNDLRYADIPANLGDAMTWVTASTTGTKPAAGGTYGICYDSRNDALIVANAGTITVCAMSFGHDWESGVTINPSIEAVYKLHYSYVDNVAMYFGKVSGSERNASIAFRYAGGQP